MFVKYVYPNGGRRAVTFSYDDGREHDRALVDIFNRHGMKATFHLNSGTLGKPGYIRAEEAAALYAGHEIAAHSVDHPFLSQQPNEALLAQLTEDRAALEAIAGYPVRGFSYPFGDDGGEVSAALRLAGFDYARTVDGHNDIRLPEDFLRWRPTCHHGAAEAPMAEFARDRRWHRLTLLYVWGHSYEFADQDNWDLIDHLCARLAALGGVWAATNADVMAYLQALRNLRWSIDGTVVLNPSALPVYIETGGGVTAIQPGLNTSIPQGDES